MDLSPSPARRDDSPQTGWRDRIAGPVVALSLAFVLGTLLLFFVYRAAFLFFLAPPAAANEAVPILLYGLRLDGALATGELANIVLAFLVFRYFRLRGFAIALAALTFVHGLVATANILFFAERNQHLWEMLIANMTHPSEIVVAVLPHVQEYPLQWTGGLLLFLALAAAACWACRRIPPLTLDLWHSRQRVGRSILVILALIVPSTDVVAQHHKYWAFGWMPMPTTSQSYMRFDRYEANQAVVNPVHDLVRLHIPAALAGMTNAKVAVSGDAISLSQSLLGVRPLDDRYPLLRKLPAGPQLGLNNVIVIAVEGLSQSILHRKEEGEYITPFLNDLAARGLYFPNFVQSYNATDGSIFSTVTGMYKTFVNQHWQNFLPIEVNSHFGSIAHVLGRETHKHYAMFGFHNRRQDFTTFLRNQGFETFDISRFHGLLGDRPRSEEVGNALGLFDHVLFEETAKVLANTPSQFTALLITATTHSPWVIASHAPRVFKNSRLNTFRYLDDSIKNFMSELAKSGRRYDETLFVITGDHTSITFSGNPMEQFRVPLILYAPRIETHALRLDVDRSTMGSHVDIVPTVLQLLDGAHVYSGMGVSLISPDRSNARVVSSSRFFSLYFRDGYAALLSPSNPGLEDTRLLSVEDGRTFASTASQSNPALLQKMRHELIVLSETSARLTKERRVFPVRRDAGDVAGVN